MLYIHEKYVSNKLKKFYHRKEYLDFHRFTFLRAVQYFILMYLEIAFKRYTFPLTLLLRNFCAVRFEMLEA